MIVVTRIHAKSASSIADVESVLKFCKSCPFASKILICLGIGDNMEHLSYFEDLRALLLADEENRDIVQLQLVCPWGGFTHALNVAIRIAVDMNESYILFKSFEVSISTAEVDALMSHMGDDTLVVGPVLNGHIFEPGIHDMCGRNCPWNTCAIWALDKLALIGFPLIGDGYGPLIPGGVEEVSAIAMAQMINYTWEAKLIKLDVADGGSLTWNTSFEDEERMQYHEKKMASKNSRPAAQMQALGAAVTPGRVMHIVCGRNA